jgi:hypothetical protein
MTGTKANRPYKKIEITPVFWGGLGFQAAIFLSIHLKMAGQKLTTPYKKKTNTTCRH